MIDAADFFTNEDAWDLYQKRLRYTVARRSPPAHYGLGDHLRIRVHRCLVARHCVNRRNEYGHSPDSERWLRRNLDFLAENDHYPRLASVHFSHPWEGAQLWRDVDELAFNNSNVYTGFLPMGHLGGAAVI